MKGISYLIDEMNQKKAVVIELATLEKHPKEIEDLLDILVAESRKNEPKFDWEEVKINLKTRGR